MKTIEKIDGYELKVGRCSLGSRLEYAIYVQDGRCVKKWDMERHMGDERFYVRGFYRMGAAVYATLQEAHDAILCRMRAHIAHQQRIIRAKEAQRDALLKYELSEHNGIRKLFDEFYRGL